MTGRERDRDQKGRERVEAAGVEMIFIRATTSSRIVSHETLSPLAVFSSFLRFPLAPALRSVLLRECVVLVLYLRRARRLIKRNQKRE